ncbi:MAG TPA: hypothetical protein VMR86_18545, partial [Myxococcota bacterium]|nr:hypothetical protein [Myxococcota bacterium]
MPSRAHTVLASVLLTIGLGSRAHAGDLKAVQHGTTLKVTGDMGGATANFTGIPDGDFLPVEGFVGIAPTGGTTVNGQTATATFSGVQTLHVFLGSGENHIQVASFNLVGDLTLKGGRGV